ncbi:MAG: hypothetical protein VXY89_10555, partial [SAR324 cluster bacterium]|nr:hypothetical protein [SAR324 cluster bacterium]
LKPAPSKRVSMKARARLLLTTSQKLLHFSKLRSCFNFKILSSVLFLIGTVAIPSHENSEKSG